MDDDDYELTPHKQLEELRHEIEILKRNPLGGARQSKDLLDSMDRLTAAVTTLIDLFKLAAKDIKDDSKEKQSDFSPMVSRLDELDRQNKIIAESMVALSETMKKAKEDDRSSFVMPPPPVTVIQPMSPPPMSMPPPNYGMQQGYQPSPQPMFTSGPPDFGDAFMDKPMAPPPNPVDIPPPPPDYPKKSLFGFKR
ncbi:MAG: hypothetical protein V1735_06385 [Nanoarchaeota archaeon]